jgi:hypothetical protein
MQVAGRTKDEDGDGDAIDIDSDSGLLGIQCVVPRPTRRSWRPRSISFAHIRKGDDPHSDHNIESRLRDLTTCKQLSTT